MNECARLGKESHESGRIENRPQNPLFLHTGFAPNHTSTTIILDVTPTCYACLAICVLFVLWPPTDFQDGERGLWKRY